MSAQYLYGACVAFGGVMLLASMLMGHGHDVGGDVGGASDGAPEHGGGGGTALAAVLNLRFWVFAATFFGLTGLALTRLGGPAARGVAPLVAVPVGLAAGFVASRIFATLGGKAVGAVAPSSSYIGREGVLLLPVSQTQRGKLRLRVGATEVDLLAETDDDVELPIGASVLVCGVRGQCLVVARNPAPSAGPATA